jgi:trk system potassium uptake protein TrkA
MRIVFTGAGPVTRLAAEALAGWGHEVIVIEVDKKKIDLLSEELDCSFLHGDASKPGILDQVDPKSGDFLFCLTDSDQVNIITALLGRSMGFRRVIPSLEDAGLEHLCSELGLDDTITPSRTMSRHLQNMVQGLDNIQLSTLLKNGARFFSFTAAKEDAGPVADLDLPEKARVVYYYRKEGFYFVEEDTRFKAGDEIVILAHSENLPELNDRWYPERIDRENVQD